MVGLAKTVEDHLSYTSSSISNSIDAEPVIVTPCRASAEFGRAAIRDHVFASRCGFSWRSETVTIPTGEGQRTLVFKRLKPMVRFDRDSLHAQCPKTGDRITRAWDGATFEIASVYRESGQILCDLIEVEPRMQ